MSRMTCHGWSLSQLIEEWNYHRDERLGILCGSAEPEDWMVKLAEADADAAVKRLIESGKTQAPPPLGGCPKH